MIFIDDPKETDERNRLTIETPQGGCVLLYRRPSVAELDRDQWRLSVVRSEEDRGAALAALYRSRREAVFVGWEGIETVKGAPLGFSPLRLLALMLRVPEVEQRVGTLLRELFDVGPMAGEPNGSPASGTPAAESLTTGPSDSPGSSNSPAEPASPSSSV